MRMSRIVSMLAAVLAGTTLAASGASANLLINGSFESPTISFPFYENYGPTNLGNYGGTSFSGWTITVNNVDIVSQVGGWPAGAADGVQYLDLVGYGSTGGIAQSFATAIGQTYSLSFAYANNPGSTSSAAANVAVLGAPGISSVFTHSISTTNNLGWTIFSGWFIANSTTSVLDFSNTVGRNNGGVLLDAVNVTAVPEPATWGLMLLGFLGVGFVSYRRSNKPAFRVA